MRFAVSDETFERIEKNAKSAQDIAELVRAAGENAKISSTGSRLLSEGFLKFFGGLLGAAVAATLLIVGGFLNTSLDALKLYDEVVSIRKVQIDDATNALAASQKELSELSQKLAQAEHEFTAKENEISALRTTISDLEAEKLRLTTYSAILGQTLFVCGEAGPRALFDETTRRHNSKNIGVRSLPLAGNFTDFSMEIFLVGDGRARHVAYGRTLNMPSSERRSATGFWKIDGQDVVVQFAYDDQQFGEMRVLVSDLIKLSEKRAKDVPMRSSLGGNVVSRLQNCGRG